MVTLAEQYRRVAHQGERVCDCQRYSVNDAARNRLLPFGGGVSGAAAAAGPGGRSGTPGREGGLAVFAAVSNIAPEQDPLSQQNGMSVQTPKQATWTQEHHPIPEFMGGNADQELYAVNQAYHQSFHELLAQNLAASEEFNFPAMNAGRDRWNLFFIDNPDSQDAAYRILLDTARQFDFENGTNFLHYTWQNIIEGNFEVALPGGE